MRPLAPVAAAVIGTVVLLAGCSPSSGVTTTPATAGQSSPAGSMPAKAPSGTGSAQAAPAEAAVRQLYRARFEGLSRGDLEGWLQGVRGARLVGEQRAIFDRMRALHVDDVVLTHVTQLGVPEPTGGTERRRMEVGLSYRLAGFDTRPRAFALEVTVAMLTGSGGSTTVIASHPADRPQPWDLPDLQVRRTGSVLVAASGTATRADEVARAAGAAAHRVAAVLGAARPAVVVAPASDDMAARLLGRQPSALDQVSAVTDGPLPAGRAGADRVVVVPGAWSSLSTTGREVVLAHELTHVTTRAEPAAHPVPLWLSEGLAEYVAYQGLPLPERTIVAPALEQARHTGVPDGWPDDAQFEPGARSLSAAYGLALLASRSIAARHGQAALVHLYRAAAAGALDAALRALGTDPAAERRAWRSRIEALLRLPGQA